MTNILHVGRREEKDGERKREREGAAYIEWEGQMVGELSPVQVGLHHGGDIKISGEEKLLKSKEEGRSQLKVIRRGGGRRGGLQKCQLVG